MKTPEQIAAEVTETVWQDFSGDFAEIQTAIAAAIEADRAQREQRVPEFAPEEEPDKYRDLWDANMPRVSSCMYFAIPGEQPIHLDDDEARHILAYLSEKNR